MASTGNVIRIIDDMMEYREQLDRMIDGYLSTHAEINTPEMDKIHGEMHEMGMRLTREHRIKYPREDLEEASRMIMICDVINLFPSKTYFPLVQ